jgi:hypothetical protein
MERDYKRLEIEDFGKILLNSNDLDPVYVALHKLHSNGDLKINHLNRWLLAYILCYHVGAACWLSERRNASFWDVLFIAAINNEESPVGGRWPRSHERRHWRGQFAVDVVQRLKERYGGNPEDFITYLTGGEQIKPEPISFKGFSARVQEHHGFGSWATFKLADLVDRLGLTPVNFSYEDVVIYKDPVEAAKMLFRQRAGLASKVEVKPYAIRGIFDYLIEHFQDYAAPPLYDRPVSVQEVESVLCKWKSHRNGRYPLFNDIREIHEGLVDWSKISQTAELFKAAMPIVPIEGT